MEMLAAIGAKLLWSLVALATGWIAVRVYRAKRFKAIEEQAKKSVQPLKDAQTAEEIDAAADNALDNF